MLINSTKRVVNAILAVACLAVFIFASASPASADYTYSSYDNVYATFSNATPTHPQMFSSHNRLANGDYDDCADCVKMFVHKIHGKSYLDHYTPKNRFVNETVVRASYTYLSRFGDHFTVIDNKWDGTPRPLYTYMSFFGVWEQAKLQYAEIEANDPRFPTTFTTTGYGLK